MLILPMSTRLNTQRWITAFGILCLHLAVFWIARPINNQHHIKVVQYLQTFNVSPVEKLLNKTIEPMPLPARNSKPGNERKADMEVVIGAPQNTIGITLPDTSITENSPALNVEALRNQAVQIEQSREKSGIEKMNDRKKLNMSIEARLDRELNQVVLPECRAALLGKPMIERMMIIQNHQREKFCR